MREFIVRIQEIGKKLGLNHNQTFFLIAAKEGVYTVDISADDMLDIVKKGLMKGNTILPQTFELLDGEIKEADVKQEEVKAVNSSYPKLTTDTGEIVKTLAKHFLDDRLTSKEFERLKSYTKNDIMIPFMFIFLEMFPTADTSKNKAWDKHFKTEWDNVTLRRMTQGTAKKFQQIWKKKDIGLFLLGTYLFISQSYNESSEKYFVKNIENYFKEYLTWYQEAEDMLENGELERFTKRKTKKAKSNNTVVL